MYFFINIYVWRCIAVLIYSVINNSILISFAYFFFLQTPDLRLSLTLAISIYKGTISVLHLRFASWLPLQREAGPSICPEGLSRLFARPIISRPATAENIHYWTALYHITQTPTSKAGLKGAETIYKSNISEILAPF